MISKTTRTKNINSDQMVCRLTISLEQLKGGNNSEKLKNKIIQLLRSLYSSKKLTKTIYNNQYYFKMETIFMNTENSKTNEPHRFRLTVADKLDLKDYDKNRALKNVRL